MSPRPTAQTTARATALALAAAVAGCTPDATELARAIRSPDDELSRAAILAAGLRGPVPATRAALIDVTEDTGRDWRTVARAAWALGHAPGADTAAALHALLTHDRPDVRAIAALALARAAPADPRTRPALERLTTDPAAAVARVARDALLLLEP